MANDKEICNSQKVLSRQYTNFVEDCNKSIWIKDKTAGIGTLTYYDTDNMTFGALGHPILDSETGTTLDIEKGERTTPSFLALDPVRVSEIKPFKNKQVE